MPGVARTVVVAPVEHLSVRLVLGRLQRIAQFVRRRDRAAQRVGMPVDRGERRLPDRHPPRAAQVDVLEVQVQLLVALPQQLPVQAVRLVQQFVRAGRAPPSLGRRSCTSLCPAPRAAHPATRDAVQLLGKSNLPLFSNATHPCITPTL